MRAQMKDTPPIDANAGGAGFLDELPKGWEGMIDSVDDASLSGLRLGSLGFLPGRQLRLARVAPMGDPIAVDIGGQRVGLRRADARAVRLRNRRAPDGAAG